MNNWEKLTLKIDQSDFLKGVAIIFVLLGHIGIVDNGGSFGVHIFLILSGYGLYCSFQKNGLSNFWKKRIIGVYCPYLFWTIITMAMTIITKKQVTILQNVVTLLGMDFGMNLDPTMWYLSYIFAFYFIFWATLKLEKNKKLSITIAMVLTFAVAVIGYKAIVWHRGIIAWAYFISFPFGVLWAKNRQRIVSNKVWGRVLIIIVGLCSAFVVINYGKQHMRIEQFLFSMAGGYGSLALYMLLREKVPAVVTELGQQIGKISFFMYLNEWYVLNWIGNKNSVPRDLWGVAVILVSIVMAVVTEKCWKLFVEGVQTLAKNGAK